MAEKEQKGITQRMLLAPMIIDLVRMGGQFNKYLDELSEAERKELTEAWDCQSHVPVGVMFNRPKF